VSQLRIREIYRDVRLTITVVETSELQRSKMGSGLQLYGSVKPLAVIVQGPDECYALDMDASPVSLDRLCEHLPELDTLMR